MAAFYKLKHPFLIMECWSDTFLSCEEFLRISYINVLKKRVAHILQMCSPGDWGIFTNEIQTVKRERSILGSKCTARPRVTIIPKFIEAGFDNDFCRMC